MNSLFDNVIITSVLTCRNQSFPAETVYAPPRGTHGLIFCIEGDQEFEYSDTTIKAEKNSLFYLPQGLPYTIRRLNNSIDIFVNFRTAGKEADQPFSKIYQNHDRILYHLKRLESIMKSRAPGFNEEAKGELYLLIAEIKRGERLSSFNSPADRSVSDAIQTIASEYCSPDLSIQKIKSETGLSERYFEKRFRIISGSTPKEYLLSLRIEKAKEELLSTDKSILKISNDCGFSDQCNFSKLFKKKTGMSPNEYRKEFKSEL